MISNLIHQQNFTHEFHIIQSILRQRQISNHGLDLLPLSIQAVLKRQCRVREVKNSIKEEGLPVFCEACNQEIEASERNAVFEHCLHLVCIKCTLGNNSESESLGACPICNDVDGGTKRVQPRVESLQAWSNEFKYSGPSSKVQALLENIKQSQQEVKDGHPIKW